MKRYICLFLLLCNVIFADPKVNTLPPQEAFEKLMEGNERFISDQSQHTDLIAERRLETIDLQEPFAVIVGCSDSRVSPELIFDQGIGDLFIVRLAGNVVGPLALESIEYATLYLHASLVLVLGHQNCGAVNAVLSGVTDQIKTIVNEIKPALKQCAHEEGDPLVNGIKCNVLHVVHKLQNYAPLKKLVKQGSLKIVGGYYSFETGEVSILH